jgi:hypothetical protein
MQPNTPVNLKANGIALTTTPMNFEHLPRAGETIVITNGGAKYTVASLGYNVQKDAQGAGTCQSIDIFLNPSA